MIFFKMEKFSFPQLHNFSSTLQHRQDPEIFTIVNDTFLQLLFFGTVRELCCPGLISTADFLLQQLLIHS